MDKKPSQNRLVYAAHLKPLQLPSLEADTLRQLKNSSLVASKQENTSKPLFSREDLEELASGKISSVFGPLFAAVDRDAHPPRFLPMPPLLLIDRIIKLEGEPLSMSTGTIWSETDISADSWYLHQGHMPVSMMVEAGQADLVLVSWVGIDFNNKDQRVYRLLGADVTFHGGLPKPGETLVYEIQLERFTKLGDFRLASFHFKGYINGELRINMKNGQAGFISPLELADSTGVVWEPTAIKFKKNAQLDPPKVLCTQRHFTVEQVNAFSEGDTFACFGAGFELAKTHQQNPRIPNGKMRFIHEVTDFDPQGGPVGRGYMRAIQNVSPDDWFFKYHFKDDPCMPGSLMSEGGVQMAYFYLAALGYTLDKEGWRLEPVPEVEMQLRCRGQCTPKTKQIVYEIFIEEIIAEPYPTIIAHLLVSIDGLKALYIQHASSRLVPP